ncbi:CHAP domain-containing protein [Chromobacterium alkanivorans]|uniref:CHAP domain-containing protein n=1 Tax=Chromobacterium alkanivorans TaxID=1071719 RepID=UPI00196719EF|nr:CHAP domain-containing protein [Chromobacterium alkanivorans]MBN3004529.1 CHAP domain-containing protein [Chromobacterium alkanivorans]
MLGQDALKIAATQLGVTEQPRGSNDGPQVRDYLASVKLGPGYAWCMAFVYWCTAKVCADLHQANPLLQTAGVMRQWNERPALRVSTPLPGDVFIMDFGKGQGHTGFVEKVLPDGRIQTVEGNTNGDGSREGYAVCRRIRAASSIKGYLRV